MRALIFGVCSIFFLLCCGLGYLIWDMNKAKSPPTKPASTEPTIADIKRTVRAPVNRPAKPVAAPAATESPKPPRTFADAWSDAEESVRLIAKSEPALTADQMKILTAGERAIAESNMKWLDSAKLRSTDSKTWMDLKAYGLDSWVVSRAAERGMRDPEFKSIASRFFNGSSRGNEIVSAAANWAILDLSEAIQVSNAVSNNTPTANLLPSTRNTIISLGGSNWLRR